MKKLFCTVVTDFDGTLDSPIIYHTRAEDVESVEKHVREELVELGWNDEELDDLFDIFTFPVRQEDIIEV